MDIFQELEKLSKKNYKKSYMGIDWKDGVGSIVIVDPNDCSIIWSWTGEIVESIFIKVVYYISHAKFPRSKICVFSSEHAINTLVKPLRRYVPYRLFHRSKYKNRSTLSRMRYCLFSRRDEDIGVKFNRRVVIELNNLISSNMEGIKPELTFLYNIILSAIVEDGKWMLTRKK